RNLSRLLRLPLLSGSGSLSSRRADRRTALAACRVEGLRPERSPMRFKILLPLFVILAATPAAAHPGWGIVIDPAGRVIFGDVDTNTIWRIEDGRTVALATGLHSHDLYLDAQGNLWGEHAAYDAPR